MEVLPFASMIVAVAFAAFGTSTFCTAIFALAENSFCLTSLEQLPLAAELVTESANFGVKIWVQIRFPSPARLAVCRSAITCFTAVLFSDLLDVSPDG